jgi:hypothetical protein
MIFVRDLLINMQRLCTRILNFAKCCETAGWDPILQMPDIAYRKRSVWLLNVTFLRRP